MSLDFFSQVTFLASLAVVVIQQILKLKFIPIAFANRYPVPTVILLSIVAAVVVNWAGWQTAHGVGQWIVLFAKICVVAAIAYNVTLKGWTQLRTMEGEGK
jgi:hypothetical protein